MKQGFHVCLYKRKGQPIITAFVKGDEAEICMSLADFKAELIKDFKVDDIKAQLLEEIGSVTWTFKKDTFEKQLDEALKNVTLEKQIDAAFDTIIVGIKQAVAAKVL
jgi:hypothetical protein